MNWKNLFRSKSISQITNELRDQEGRSGGLNRTLGVWDLTTFGVAAILGAGIFSTIGNAAAYGGPAIVFLFIFTAVACAFCACCYAEFASSIPIAGSAYTYAYASFGELIAWVIGWDLLMEYAIGDIAIAISWSQYFTGLLAGYGIFIPKFLTMDFLSAYRGFQHVEGLLSQGQTLAQVAASSIEPIALKGFFAWTQAPRFFNIPVICDLPALLVTVLITWVVFMGIEDSKRFSQVLVGLKILVVFFVIGVGATCVHPSNWVPFAPHGVGGVLKGVSAVFFAYIGFDAISTTAEECKNPQRDLPRGMIYSLVICTILYSLLALVLTGVVNYQHLGVGNPLAFIFGPEGANMPWVSGMISASAVVALSTVLLVFQLGQTRIWMAMSRDGLLPPMFSKIHPKYRTPWISTLLAGVLVAVPSLFLNLTEVTDLNSIGTLFAFVIVCAGSLRMNRRTGEGRSAEKKFQIPYVNSQYLFPGLLILVVLTVLYFNPQGVEQGLGFAQWSAGVSRWEWLKPRIPFFAFSLEMLVLGYYCLTRKLSLIPVLGLSTCSYFITELGIKNWIRFGGWLVVGGIVYFLYGLKHSKLQKQASAG